MKARTVRLALEFADVFVLAAMRAVWTIGPTLRLKVFAGLAFVTKDRKGKVGHDRGFRADGRAKSEGSFSSRSEI